MLAEIHGLLIRTNAVARKASSHDLTQDARIAELESGWRRTVIGIKAFLDHPNTQRILRILAWVLIASIFGEKAAHMLEGP